MQNAIVTHKVHAKKTKWTQTPPDGFMSNSAAPEQMNMAGDGVPPNRWDSLSDDVAGLRKDGLAHKPGSDALAGGSKTCSTSGGDRKVTATSSEGTVPNTSQISPAMAQKINYNIKYELRKEVRKFGRKYERIFTLLEGVQGPPAVKKQFVDFTIQEAARWVSRRALPSFPAAVPSADRGGSRPCLVFPKLWPSLLVHAISVGIYVDILESSSFSQAHGTFLAPHSLGCAWASLTLLVFC
ncbi:integrator complex subunit 6-like isoform X1 [Equus asinus]